MLTKTILVCLDELLTRKSMTFDRLAATAYITPERIHELFTSFPNNLTVDELQRIVVAMELTHSDLIYARHALPMWVWRGFASQAFSKLAEAANQVSEALNND